MLKKTQTVALVGLFCVLLPLVGVSCKPKKQAAAVVASAPENRMAFVTWTADLMFDVGKPTERSLQCLYYYENTLQWFRNNPESSKRMLLHALVAEQPGNVRYVNTRAVDPEALAAEMERLSAVSEAAIAGGPELKGQSLLSQKGTLADRLRILAAHRLDTKGGVSAYTCPPPQALSAVLMASADPSSGAAAEFETRISITNAWTADGRAVKESGLAQSSGASDPVALNLSGGGLGQAGKAALKALCLRAQKCDDLLRGLARNTVGRALEGARSAASQVSKVARGTSRRAAREGAEVAAREGTQAAAGSVAREGAEAAATQTARRFEDLTPQDIEFINQLGKTHNHVQISRDRHARILTHVRKDAAALRQRAGFTGQMGGSGQVIPPDTAKSFLQNLGDDLDVVSQDPALLKKWEVLDQHVTNAYDPRGGFRGMSQKASMSEPQFQSLYREFVDGLAARKVNVARNTSKGGKVTIHDSRKGVGAPDSPAVPPEVVVEVQEAASAASTSDAKTGPVQRVIGFLTGKNRRQPVPQTIDDAAIMKSPESPLSSLDKPERPKTPGLPGKLFNFGKTAVSVVAWSVAPGLVMNLFNSSQGGGSVPPGEPVPEEVSVTTSDDVPWMSAQEELDTIRNPPPETMEALKQGLEASAAAVGLPLDEILGEKGTSEQRRQLALQLEQTLGMCWTIAICTTSNLNLDDAAGCLARQCNDPGLN